MKQTIFLASDHAGVELKLSILKHLNNDDRYEVINLGTDTFESVDYPDYAHLLCSEMDLDDDRGILICGTGVGMSMVANRYEHIRCAVVANGYVAEMARKHNDANVIALGARVLHKDGVINIVETFLDTEFEGGRHQNRIDKFNNEEVCDEEAYEEQSNAFAEFVKSCFRRP